MAVPNRKSFKGGGVIFIPKISIADSGNFKQGFLSMKLIQKSDLKAHFEEGSSSHTSLGDGGHATKSDELF